MVKMVGTFSYWSEMGQEKPFCDIEAKLSYVPNKWRIVTDLKLKGVGIKFFDSTIEGKSVYYVTERAFDKLKLNYSISIECLLD